MPSMTEPSTWLMPPEGLMIVLPTSAATQTFFTLSRPAATLTSATSAK